MSMPTTNQTKINGIDVLYTQEVITVCSSYMLKYDAVRPFCYQMERDLPFRYVRSADSWTREIVAHNMLYDLGLFIDHTKDTDIEDHENTLRLICFDILYALATIYYCFHEIGATIFNSLRSKK